MSFQIETQIGDTWQNTWTDTDADGNETPVTFPTQSDAEEALAEFKRESAGRTDGMAFRIMPAILPHYDLACLGAIEALRTARDQMRTALADIEEAFAGMKRHDPGESFHGPVVIQRAEKYWLHSLKAVIDGAAYSTSLPDTLGEVYGELFGKDFERAMEEATAMLQDGYSGQQAFDRVAELPDEQETVARDLLNDRCNREGF